MRTPKRLYAHERVISHPALLTCPPGGDLLVLGNYLAWAKTVQMLDRVVSVASRPGRCPHATGVGSRLRVLSAAGQRIAPPGSTSGYDVVVHIGFPAVIMKFLALRNYTLLYNGLRDVRENDP